MSAAHTPPPQLDLFASTAAPHGLLHGIATVRVDYPCRRCWSWQVVIVDVATGPHAALLRCDRCDRFRQWLPLAAYKFLREVVRNFGRPTEPIRIFETSAAAALSGGCDAHQRWRI